MFYGESVKGFEALNFSNLLHLQDCGLVNVGPGLVKIFNSQDVNEFLVTYQDIVLEISKDAESKDEIRVPDILLTTPGKELSLIVQGTSQMEYLRAFSKFLESKKCQLFYLDGAVLLPDGRIRYTGRTFIDPNPEQPDEATP